MKKGIFRKFISLALLAAVVAGILSFGGLSPAKADNGHAENVILLIGDGMGYAQITAARLAQGKKLNMDRIKTMGTMTTVSANNIVTDSAAAGTAMATGFKTNNGMISVTPDGKNLKTILEAAREKGKATGLVTTTRITHATPAVFASHVGNRDDEDIIAAQMLNTNVDVMLGGGKSFFLPKAAGGKRTDNRNLIDKAKKNGYTVVTTGDELAGVSGGKVLGLFNNSHMNYEVDRDLTKEPSLAAMTAKAISLLDKDNNKDKEDKEGKNRGFYLMVEGGRIDHAAHANDPAGAVGDTLAFDAAVKVALDYAEKNRDTMVIVTADHETGGLIIGAGGEDAKSDIAMLGKVTKTAEYMGKQIKADSSQIDAVFARYAGITDLTAVERAGIETASDKALAAANVISARAGVKFNTGGHTGVTVPVMVTGEKEYEFSGLIDNTQIAKIIADAMNLELN